MEDALIIFAKNPIHGQVKTRLASTIGNDKALAIYTQLLNYTEAITNQLPVAKFLFYLNSIEINDHWRSDIYTKRVQRGADLGEKMYGAFKDVFKEGYQRLVIIGTDCPELSVSIITSAFNSLKKNDIVIGPAKDGGYYLLGMKTLQPELFKNISWSTKEVLQQTLNVCSAAGLSCMLLEELSDIDTEEDLVALKPLNGSNYD